MPYRLAMAQYTAASAAVRNSFLRIEKESRILRGCLLFCLERVGTGIRTLGLQSHNLAR